MASFLGASAPVDQAAGGDVLGVARQHRPGELEHRPGALVGDAVVDGPVLAPCGDESAPAQAGEVGGGARLAGAYLLDDLTDRKLALPVEQLEDVKPRRVAEGTEVLGQQLALTGLARDPERRREEPLGRRWWLGGPGDVEAGCHRCIIYE